MGDLINDLGDEYSYFKEALSNFGFNLYDVGGNACRFHTVHAFTNDALRTFLADSEALADYLDVNVEDLPPLQIDNDVTRLEEFLELNFQLLYQLMTFSGVVDFGGINGARGVEFEPMCSPQRVAFRCLRMRQVSMVNQ